MKAYYKWMDILQAKNKPYCDNTVKKCRGYLVRQVTVLLECHQYMYFNIIEIR